MIKPYISFITISYWGDVEGVERSAPCLLGIYMLLLCATFFIMTIVAFKQLNRDAVEWPGKSRMAVKGTKYIVYTLQI